MSAWRSVPVNVLLIACTATRQRGSSYSTLINLRHFIHQSPPTAFHRALHTIRAAPVAIDQHQRYSAIPRGQLSAVPIVYHEVRLSTNIMPMLCNIHLRI